MYIVIIYMTACNVCCLHLCSLQLPEDNKILWPKHVEAVNNKYYTQVRNKGLCVSTVNSRAILTVTLFHSHTSHVVVVVVVFTAQELEVIPFTFQQPNIILQVSIPRIQNCAIQKIILVCYGVIFFAQDTQWGQIN